jgi:hypothetical protein
MTKKRTAPTRRPKNLLVHWGTEVEFALPLEEQPHPLPRAPRTYLLSLPLEGPGLNVHALELTRRFDPARSGAQKKA